VTGNIFEHGATRNHVATDTYYSIRIIATEQADIAVMVSMWL
jgi:hypothetical protein